MPFTPILATLGYVFSPQRDRVLMVHRVARGQSDPHHGKWNGLGGKLEADEDVASGMIRELREEAGIEATELQLAGTISWPGFGKKGEDWFGFIFRILAYTGTPLSTNDEGRLDWIPLEVVPTLPMWEGDRHFLPFVLNVDSLPFHGVMPYRDGQPLSWSTTIVRT